MARAEEPTGYCETCGGPKYKTHSICDKWCGTISELREKNTALEDRIFELEEACADNGIHKGV